MLHETLHAAIDDHTFYPYPATTTDTWAILEVADQGVLPRFHGRFEQG